MELNKGWNKRDINTFSLGVVCLCCGLGGFTHKLKNRANRCNPKAREHAQMINLSSQPILLMG